MKKFSRVLAAVLTAAMLIFSFTTFAPISAQKLATHSYNQFWLSPDGTQIAALDQYKGGNDIDLMNIDGSDAHVIHSLPEALTDFIWAPNSQMYAISDTNSEGVRFTVFLASGNVPIYTGRGLVDEFTPDSKNLVIEVGSGDTSEPGSYLVDLTGGGFGLKFLTKYETLRFSPDGKIVLYVAARDNINRIFLMNADGTNPRELATGGVDPSWSPIGDKIMFIDMTYDVDPSADPSWSLNIINVDGSGELQLLAGKRGFVSYAWDVDSPMYLAVAKTAGPTDPVQIYLADTAGGVMHSLTTSGYNFDPAFSPDGNWIYYVANAGGLDSIRRVDAHGGTSVLVAN